MALVKCPECGRENISDSEENCPNCCYGIKAYYDLIKHEEEKQEQARQEQIRQEQAKQEQAKQEVLKRSQIEIAELKYREEFIKSVPRLKRPKLVAPILILLISPLCFLFGKLELESPVKGIPRGIPQTDYYDPVVAGVLYIVIGIGFICYAIYLFYKRMKRYRLSKISFEEYQRQVIRAKEQGDKAKGIGRAIVIIMTLIVILSVVITVIIY